MFGLPGQHTRQEENMNPAFALIPAGKACWILEVLDSSNLRGNIRHSGESRNDVRDFRHEN